MQFFKIIGLLILAAILVGLSMIVYSLAPKMQARVPQIVISNFEECAAAGNPVMESYPRQCRTKDGRHFVEDVPPIEMPEEGLGLQVNGCAVAGCSGQLCVSADEAGTIMTTCEFRAEYACYKKASCEPQANGKCGWTQTAELTQCLANPPALETSLEVM